MAFELPALPYEKNALEPHISQETLEYHHGKHHNTYVQKLNGLIEGTEFADKSLEEIITPLGLDLDQFESVCDTFTNRRIFQRDSEGRLVKDSAGNLTKLNYDNA